MSQNAGVNYVHYGLGADSGSIEVTQLQQIKGCWRSHRPPLLHTPSCSKATVFLT